MNLLKNLINQNGVCTVSKMVGVSHTSIRKWYQRGRLPRTDITGETQYAKLIEKATDGAVRAQDLLDESLKEYKKKRKRK